MMVGMREKRKKERIGADKEKDQIVYEGEVEERMKGRVRESESKGERDQERKRKRKRKNIKENKNYGRGVWLEEWGKGGEWVRIYKGKKEHEALAEAENDKKNKEKINNIQRIVYLPQCILSVKLPKYPRHFSRHRG